MPGTLMRTHDGLLARRFRQEEDGPGLRIAPGMLEVRVLLTLDVQVLLMCLHQLFCRDALHVAIHVDVLRHRPPLSTSAIRRESTSGQLEESTRAVGLAQHPDEYGSWRPILLAVHQEF